jgi:hypothetical protein
MLTTYSVYTSLLGIKTNSIVTLDSPDESNHVL